VSEAIEPIGRVDERKQRKRVSVEGDAVESVARSNERNFHSQETPMKVKSNVKAGGGLIRR
jgi:hypothetical protein